MSDWKTKLEEELMVDEGFRSHPYKCTAGVWTQGYGHTSGVTKSSPPISREDARALLSKDIKIAIEDARACVSCFDELDPVRKCVVANMAFNLGRTKLSQFKRTIREICAGKYQTAALYMMESLWARQVKGRAVRLSKMMSTGKYQNGS